MTPSVPATVMANGSAKRIGAPRNDHGTTANDTAQPGECGTTAYSVSAAAPAIPRPTSVRTGDTSRKYVVYATPARVMITSVIAIHSWWVGVVRTTATA